jgi:methyl-accepting chemotaxis protein WspA
LAAFRNGGGNSHKRLHVFEDRDETSDLLAAFRTMAGNLDALIGQVQRSGIQVNSSSTEIAASARALEGTVAEQASSLREVAATSKEISATSTQLLTTMAGVSEAVAEAGAKAKAGHGDLNRMQEAMQQLLKSTASVSSRLGAISDRAGKISGVVTAINKISDQTGMLALNAAIEAEKAGEYGKGFSVVAREIGRLSDQTAAATEEIESVIREMQSSVSGGVMEMDRFSEEVRRRVEEVETVVRQLSLIIDQAQALGPQFETVNSSMRAQTEGAQQISQVIAQIAEAAERTRVSVQEFKQAAAQLYSAVQGLQTEVAHFKISA